MLHDMLCQHAAVFLDLNGTLVEPVQPVSLQEMSILAGAPQAVARLADAGFVLPVVTVQSRIAKGCFSERDFRDWFDALRRGPLIGLGPVYVCPHRFTHDCDCQKPKTKLYEKAAEDLSIDLSRSFVVGDSGGDVEAAEHLGARACLVRSGWGRMNEEEYGGRVQVVCDGVLEAADWIVGRAYRV